MGDRLKLRPASTLARKSPGVWKRSRRGSFTIGNCRRPASVYRVCHTCLRPSPLVLLTEEVEKQGEHTLNDRWADSPDYVRDRRDHQSEKFVLTGQAATKHAGPAVSLSFILAGITCAFTGLAMRNSLRPFR